MIILFALFLWIMIGVVHLFNVTNDLSDPQPLWLHVLQLAPIILILLIVFTIISAFSFNSFNKDDEDI